MTILRKPETDEKYIEYRKSREAGSACTLCQAEAIKEFNHWKISPNSFPYDAIAELHHMLLPKRCVNEWNLNAEEKNEYENIKREYIGGNYEYIMETTDRNKTVPRHFHVHLINTIGYKDKWTGEPEK